MYNDHSPCLYYDHSTCTYCDHNTCMYYDHITCTYYDHSTGTPRGEGGWEGPAFKPRGDSSGESWGWRAGGLEVGGGGGMRVVLGPQGS